MHKIIGWDIGGAHLKAGVLRNTRIEAVEQLACPLWLGVEHLPQAWRTVVERFGSPERHAVTMTGELAEIFPDRRSGVAAICRAASELAGSAPVQFYGGEREFLDEAAAIGSWQHVASANWHASAAWAGRRIRQGLFIDIGSTTTDIIPLAEGRPAMRGFTDADRLEAGELVYTGVMRTSLMTLGGEAPFGGRRQRLMAENFATTADLYRLSGDLASEDDSYPASDGRSKSAGDCRARIARMFGRDADEASAAAWDEIARLFRERQLQHLGEAVAQVLSGTVLPADAPFIAAGAGHFLVPELARRFGRPARAFPELVSASTEAYRKTGTCAPAVAVALLAAGV